MTKPVNLAILWHMHQPDYRDPHSHVAASPWVRLRATKDYLDMLFLANENNNIKVTFNLVPSLIEQLNFYSQGGTDNHFELCRMDSSTLTHQQKHLILLNCFKCHPETMIRPYTRYNQLYRKWQSSAVESSVADFSAQEILDLQVWSNLTWVDPLFRSEKILKELFEKGEGYTNSQKLSLLNWQTTHITKIIPAYQKSFNSGQIEISFSPYFHPILPLLCDTDSAKEALPDITLPAERFLHPEDAQKQMQMSIDLFKDLFGRELNGMWPSEGSISDDVARLASSLGLKWMASDEQVLYRSLQKSQMNLSNNHPYSIYSHSSGIKLFFRDHVLSDKIAFVYSTWDPEKAANDFISHIKTSAARLSNGSDDFVVPVILDGENSWEFYQNDGLEFLRSLYQQLSIDKDIKTITMSEAVETIASKPLESISAGSWINNNFRIWIGHEEDNTAWKHLTNTRNFVAEFQKKSLKFDADAIAAAWREIYIAEGSDWFWWYGDEHRGTDNYIFDNLFRSHLIKAYELLGEKAPGKLRLPIISQKYGLSIMYPDSILTPTIDGKITHFYEWLGAGKYQCVSSDAAMHRVSWLISAIHFGFDHDMLYMRLDFTNLDLLKTMSDPRIEIIFDDLASKKIKLPLANVPFESKEPGAYLVFLTNILEMSIERKFLWTEGFGKLAFRVELYDKGQLFEKWPQNENIEYDLPEKNKEAFWH